MPLRGDICKFFNHTMFRFYLRKKYKRSDTFAKRIGVHKNTVCAWRLGQKKPTWRHLIKMAEILNVAPRLLIIKSKQHILDTWEDHLIDYLEAPPEVKEQTKTELTLLDGEGQSTKESETKTKRELKLTAKEAIVLTERLGYFDERDTEDAVEQGEAEAQDEELLEVGDTPEISDEELSE